jgi:hypothetical protein
MLLARPFRRVLVPAQATASTSPTLALPQSASFAGACPLLDWQLKVEFRLILKM